MDKISKHLLDDSLTNYNDEVVPKVSIFSGKDITSDVYYFKPGQVLKAHRHPKGEQIFTFLKGKGKMVIEEESFEVDPGTTIMVEAGKWHEITNGKDEEMVAVQVTKIDAGAEYK